MLSTESDFFLEYEKKMDDELQRLTQDNLERKRKLQVVGCMLENELKVKPDLNLNFDQNSIPFIFNNPKLKG